MSQSCPICGIPWPAPLACCPCGFAPSAVDGFETQLRLERKRAALQQVIGLVMMLPLPLLYILTTDPVWLAPTVASLGVFAGGTTVLARGMVRAGRSTRRLRALATLRQLPAARVL